MSNLTAWKAPQNLREHALAFWAYYNPGGRSLDEMNIELDESSINGILVLTLLESVLDQETFNRRVDLLVVHSGGALNKSVAKRLLARAIGYPGSAGALEYRLRERPFENPNYGERAEHHRRAGKKGASQATNRAHRIARMRDEGVTEADLLQEMRSYARLTKAQLLRYVRDLRAYRLVKQPLLDTTKKKLVRRDIANALGYERWMDLYRIFVIRQYVVNMNLAPPEELPTLRQEMQQEVDIIGIDPGSLEMPKPKSLT